MGEDVTEISMVERVARAVDSADWENWDNWVGMKKYSPEEAAVEFKTARSLQASLRRAEAAIDAMRAYLQDSHAVYVNMLHGAVAKPNIEQLRHLYPEQTILPAADLAGRVEVPSITTDTTATPTGERGRR
jgi:hypothetical protein